MRRYLVGFALVLNVAVAHATNFTLADWQTITASELEGIVPGLTKSFPRADFFTTGWSSPRDSWKFVRIENECIAEVCPTVVVHSSATWNVLVYASREITCSMDNEDGESVTCNVTTIRGRKISIRYIKGTRTIFVAP